MLGRRSVPWTDLQPCSTWGEAARKRRENLGHHPPHPLHNRDDRMTTTLSRSTRLRPTNGHVRGQDPPRGQSSSHSLETTIPRTIGVATESLSREGAEEGLYIEPAQFGQSPEGQGAASIFQPGLQPQPGGHQVQTPTGPNKPYSGFDEAFKRWGPSSERDAPRDLK